MSTGGTGGGGVAGACTRSCSGSRPPRAAPARGPLSEEPCSPFPAMSGFVHFLKHSRQRAPNPTPCASEDMVRRAGADAWSTRWPSAVTGSALAPALPKYLSCSQRFCRSTSNRERSTGHFPWRSVSKTTVLEGKQMIFYSRFGFLANLSSHRRVIKGNGIARMPELLQRGQAVAARKRQNGRHPLPATTAAAEIRRLTVEVLADAAGRQGSVIFCRWFPEGEGRCGVRSSAA